VILTLQLILLNTIRRFWLAANALPEDAWWSQISAYRMPCCVPAMV